MNDDDNIFKRNPPDTIRFMSKEENPYINRADIIPDMSTFGISKPGAGIGGIPNHDSLIGSGPEPEYPGEHDDGLYDFGTSRAEFRPEAGDARDRGDLHVGIADAVGQLDGFTNDLTRDDAFETYPTRLSAETRRIRHEIGGRIADGQKRDLFDDAFELMSQNAATEIRGVATERMVARNRDGLNKALDIYAGLIARSGNPVTTDFAGNQGLTAIDAQIQDGIIDETEGARLRTGFLTNIDDRSAVSLIQDDPDAALAELNNPVAYPNLPPERINELSAHATMRREAAKLDSQQAAARAEKEALLAQSRAADAFETQYRSALSDGTATLAQISDGALVGTITPDRAARLTQAHEAAQAKRQDEFRLAEIVSDALETGGTLDPNDPDHIRAVDHYFTTDILPGLIQARTPREIAIFRDRIGGLGIAPPGMVKKLDLWWRSDHPGLAEKAARFVVLDPRFSGPFAPAPRPLPRPDASKGPAGPVNAIARYDEYGPSVGPANAVARYDELPQPGELFTNLAQSGMHHAVELLNAGMPAEQAVPTAKQMAAEDAAVTSASNPERAGPIDQAASNDAVDESDAAPGPDEMLDGESAKPDGSETFDLTDDDFGGTGSTPLTSGTFKQGADGIAEIFNAKSDESSADGQDPADVDGGNNDETAPRSLSHAELDARMEAVQQLYRDAVNPALNRESQDSDFRARAVELGLDPDRAELHRDIARVSPETEAGVRARFEGMTGPGPDGQQPRIDPIYRVVLDRKVKDNLGLAANDPERAFVAGRMANLLGRRGVNVTRRIAAEDLGLAAGIGALGKGVAGAAASRGRGTAKPGLGPQRTPGPGRESDFSSPKEFAAYRSRRHSGIPLGFASQAQKQAFIKSIAEPLEAAGYKDAKIAIRGSAVTDAKFNKQTRKYDGPEFDIGTC
jgi:hypothetical protein